MGWTNEERDVESQFTGELWLGLESLHQLTSGGAYRLHIAMKDFDNRAYEAVYESFQVTKNFIILATAKDRLRSDIFIRKNVTVYYFLAMKILQIS